MTRREHSVGARLRLEDAGLAAVDGNGHAKAAVGLIDELGPGSTRRAPADDTGPWFDLDGADR
jgi:hypothetical protein